MKNLRVSTILTELTVNFFFESQAYIPILLFMIIPIRMFEFIKSGENQSKVFIGLWLMDQGTSKYQNSNKFRDLL